MSCKLVLHFHLSAVSHNELAHNSKKCKDTTDCYHIKRMHPLNNQANRAFCTISPVHFTVEMSAVMEKNVSVILSPSLSSSAAVSAGCEALQSHNRL